MRRVWPRDNSTPWYNSPPTSSSTEGTRSGCCSWSRGIASRLYCLRRLCTMPPRVHRSATTMIVSMDLLTGKKSTVSALTGPSSTIYVSTSNIYIVYTNYPDIFAVDRVPDNVFTGGIISPANVQQGENSTMLRASYADGVASVAATRAVPGTVLNQFSLDEYDGYFRMATSRFVTIGGISTRSDDVSERHGAPPEWCGLFTLGVAMGSPRLSGDTSPPWLNRFRNGTLVRRIPPLSHDDILVGVISMQDIFSAFVSWTHHEGISDAFHC